MTIEGIEQKTIRSEKRLLKSELSRVVSMLFCLNITTKVASSFLDYATVVLLLFYRSYYYLRNTYKIVTKLNG